MINKAIIICAIITYLCNSIVLKLVYPNIATDYDEFLEYYRTRCVLYELIFFWLFMLVFRVGSRSVRSMSAFAMILVSGSLMDKAFFKISDYLWTDILLFAVASLVSLKVYKHGRGIQ